MNVASLMLLAKLVLTYLPWARDAVPADTEQQEEESDIVADFAPEGAARRTGGVSFDDRRLRRGRASTRILRTRPRRLSDRRAPPPLLQRPALQG